MTETAIIEAVRAVQGAGVQTAGTQAIQSAADPQAVAAFQQAMATPPVAEVPFADQVAATWKAAQVDRQGLLHRISKLSDMARVGGANLAGLAELQYNVMDLSFQQEIVTSVAKKASDAVSTLVKNG